MVLMMMMMNGGDQLGLGSPEVIFSVLGSCLVFNTISWCPALERDSLVSAS